MEPDRHKRRPDRRPCGMTGMVPLAKESVFESGLWTEKPNRNLRDYLLRGVVRESMKWRVAGTDRLTFPTSGPRAYARDQGACFRGWFGGVLVRQTTREVVEDAQCAGAVTQLVQK